MSYINSSRCTLMATLRSMFLIRAFFFASMIGVSPVPFVVTSNPIEALVSYTLGVPLQLAMIDI